MHIKRKRKRERERERERVPSRGDCKDHRQGNEALPRKGPRGRTDANHGGRPSGQECVHSTPLASKQARERERERDINEIVRMLM